MRWGAFGPQFAGSRPSFFDLTLFCRSGVFGRAAYRQACQRAVRPLLAMEHPFGTLKFWMGAVHFLTKTLPRVSTEMSLHVLAYNLKRVMQILGIGQMLRVLRA
jgi:hypothetical protein